MELLCFLDAVTATHTSPRERVDETESIFGKLGGDVSKQIYKGMGHTVNEDEIKAVRGVTADVLFETSRPVKFILT